VKRSQLRWRDRFFWVTLSKLWKDLPEVLIIVKADTVVKWHRCLSKRMRLDDQTRPPASTLLLFEALPGGAAFGVEVVAPKLK